MTASTSGLDVPARSRWLRDSIELLSSMRFAISLLTVICIASVIGTVVKQHEATNNYINQFGPFWAQVFEAASLTTVYSAWWFLLILAFLVLSTSLCIARNAPKIVADLRNYKENIREQGLQAFHLKGQAHSAETPSAAFERISTLLLQDGWKAKAQVREGGTMIAARRGAANKLGYIAAHSAIVLICIGGLFDGDLIVKAQMLLQGKTPFSGGGLIQDVPAQHRLGPDTPTFRANLMVPEGGRASTAIINTADGVVLQDLPFDVELKKFVVDYYDTGMPKLFASDIVIRDHETGQTTTTRVKVNEPAFHRGVAIYQSSFDDGGSNLTLRGLPLKGASAAFDVQGVVGGSTQLSNGQGDKAGALTLEFTGLRVINVENMGASNPGGRGSATDVRGVDLGAELQKHLGSGAKPPGDKVLQNVGPSVSYKLRDAAGQAREFNNYMLPVALDGQRVFLAGARDTPAEPFRYLRIPADDQGNIDGWMALRSALASAPLRDQAVKRYVALATPADKPAMAEQLQATASRALALFAGAEAVKDGQATTGGLQAISDFLEASVPEADRMRISDVLLRILNGTLFELYNLTREQAKLAPLGNTDAAQGFMTLAVLSLSDSYFYPAPVLFMLSDFKQVQASVFQVARAPGKNLVYLGAVFLIIGVFAMLYIRERRLWVWISAEGSGTRISTALSTTRRTLDADAEFETLKRAILPAASAPHGDPAP
jgi:cytochrome c biogenesis protein